MLVQALFFQLLPENIVLLRAFALENTARTAQQCLFPLSHLTRMNLIAFGDLMDWLLLRSASRATLLLNSELNLRLFFIAFFTLVLVGNLSNFTGPAHTSVLLDVMLIKENPSGLDLRERRRNY